MKEVYAGLPSADAKPAEESARSEVARSAAGGGRGGGTRGPVVVREKGAAAGIALAPVKPVVVVAWRGGGASSGCVRLEIGSERLMRRAA